MRRWIGAIAVIARERLKSGETDWPTRSTANPDKLQVELSPDLKTVTMTARGANQSKAKILMFERKQPVLENGRSGRKPSNEKQSPVRPRCVPDSCSKSQDQSFRSCAEDKLSCRVSSELKSFNVDSELMFYFGTAAEWLV